MRWRRHHDDVLPPVAPPLDPLEVEHYHWLIDGLLHGAEKQTEKPTVRQAIHHARDLFSEFIVRVEEEVART